MNFINNLKMKNKLLLMLIFPILGLIYFSISGIWEKTHELRAMRDLQELSRLSEKISLLVHELQKERGSTALFMGSKGVEFVSELSDQRSETDKRITDLQGFLTQFNSAGYGSDFKKLLDGVMGDLGDIKSKRSSASSLGSAVDEIIAYYTGLNAQFINTISYMAKVSSNADISTVINAYAAILNAKERAGVERAILSATFARDGFAPGAFRKFSSVVSAQSTYTDVFLSFASTEEKDFYKTKMQGQFADEAERMRNAAFEKASVGKFGIEPSYWFKMQTGKINLFKEVEDRLNSNLNAKAGQLRGSAQGVLIFYVVVTSVVVVIAVVLAYIVMRSITRPLNAMAEGSKRLAAGDADVSMDMNSKDEVGMLAQAFRETIDYLKAMSKAADSVAEGDLSAEVTPKSAKDVLGNAFKNMNAYLKNMAHTAEAIAEGDLKKNVEPKTDKDVLGNSFKKMIIGLRGIVGEVRRGSEEISSASSEVAATSEQSSKNAEAAATAVEEITSTMHEMSANIRNVAKTIQSQSASVTQTTTSIEQLIASIQKVSENAKRLADIAQQSSRIVGEGKDAVVYSSDGVRNITGVMTTSADAIRLLGSRTEDIGKIIEVIDDMAEQTNLLALNAAIEAARAGEHGLGFAVVAEEVRKLAERSAKSTAEISELIYGIQKEAAKAVKNVEKNVEVVDKALGLSREVEQALRKIEDSVGEVARYSQEIGAATSEQAGGCDQISKAVGKLNEITQEISSSADEQASGVEQVVKGVEKLREMVQQNASSSTELASSAEEMSRQSEGLNDVAARFSLDDAVISVNAGRKKKAREEEEKQFKKLAN